jgi:glycerophosphoryl diester phosphodiesterase
MRPLIISHAACGGHAPENTLAGIRKAIDLGSEAIEIDVQASADGVPVLMHDLTLDRTTKKSGALREMTLDELRALDVGGEPVPMLAEVLELTKGKVLLVMEIKQPGVEADIARVVHDMEALDDVMAWSFFPEALEGMRAAEPKVPRALLIGGESMPKWERIRASAIRMGVQGVSVFNQSVDEAVAKDCRRRGLALYTWTPDSTREIERLVALGVDGVCSNFPEKVVGALGRRSAA